MRMYNMKKQFQKLLSALTAATMICGCLTGCTSQKLPEPTEELVVDFPMSFDAAFEPIIVYLAKNYSDPKFSFDYTYETDYTFGQILRFGVNIEGVKDYHNIPTERAEMIARVQAYYDEQKNALVKGEAKDIIFADSAFQSTTELTPNDYTKMMKSGAFTDLLPLLSIYAPDLDLSAYEGLLTADGKLYAIPVFTNSFYLPAAESVLKQWNFEVNPEDDILTFLRKCKAWQDANADDPNAPAVFSKPAWEFLLQNLITIISTDSIDWETNTLDLTSAEIKEIFTLLCELQSDAEETEYCPTQESYQNQYGTFLFGCRMGVYNIIMHHQVYITYLKAGHRTVVMPLRNFERKINASAAAYMLIPSNAKNQVNAVKFIASYLQARYQDPAFHCNGMKLDFCEYPEEGAKVRCEKFVNDHASQASEDFAETMWDLYEDRGDICMPSYWYHSLKYLFDDYMNGEMSIDELMTDVQDRLKIYVSE